MKTRHLGLLLAAALAAVPAVGQAERPQQIDSTRTDKIRLAYSFSRGQARTIALQAAQVTEGLQGTDGSVNVLNVTAPFTVEVQRMTDDGRAVVSASISPQSVTYSSGGANLSSDSISQALRSARLSFTIASDGTISERSGSVPADTTGAAAGAYIQDAISLTWIQFPQEDVGVGSTWLQIIPLSMNDERANMSATISVKYTLSGFAMVNGREHAVIDAQYNTFIEGQAGGGDSNQREFRIVGRGQGEGYILFDFRSGRLTEASARNGMVITTTENSGFRTVRAFSSELAFGDADAVVAAPTPTE